MLPPVFRPRKAVTAKTLIMIGVGLLEGRRPGWVD